LITDCFVLRRIVVFVTEKQGHVSHKRLVIKFIPAIGEVQILIIILTFIVLSHS
jgi:hypothetical protein